MLFLGWLLAAFLVVGLINLYLRFFGRLKAKGSAQNGVLKGGTWIPGVGTTGGESCQWVNSAISWLYLHYDHTPQFVEAWLKALNEQVRKGPGDVQVKINRIQAGSLPPKFTQIQTTVGPQDTLTIHTVVESSDITFLVSTLNQTKVSNCDVTVQKLQGQLKVVARYTVDQIDVTGQFVTRPDLKLQVKQRTFEVPGRAGNVNPKTLESTVRNAIGSAITSFSFSPKSGASNFYSPMKAETIEAQSAGTLSSGRVGPLRDRRLLVKVIKANGLGEKEFGCSDPYCIVHMDEPPQKHTTSVVKNTNNPFWDEHFLFDLDEHTRQVKFDVHDRDKPPGEDFLGSAVIPMMELRRMPSSRQIIPLQGRQGSFQHSSQSGSITVEFLFMEPAEAQQMQLNTTPLDLSDTLSPRRRIDTNRTIMPGGTVVTMTTTTTQKPKDIRLDSSYNESPNRIQKTENMSNLRGGADTSPFSSRSSQLGTVDSSTAASQAPGYRPMGSPQLTVTKPSASGGKYQSSGHHMTESTPPEEGRDARSLSSPSVGSADQKDLKKSKSFANTLKKRFSRGPKKPRSHSADRASTYRDGSLLRPPDQVAAAQGRTTDDMYDAEVRVPEDGIRKTRSHSFSSSLKRMFRKKKKVPTATLR